LAERVCPHLINHFQRIDGIAQRFRHLESGLNADGAVN
jgi:hypothetical protein